MTTKNDVVAFFDEWLSKDFPLKTRGESKGQPKWDIIKSKLSEHLELVKTTDNEFMVKVIMKGYQGILTNNYEDMVSLASLFSVENMKVLKLFMTVMNEKSNTISSSKKTKSVI